MTRALPWVGMLVAALLVGAWAGMLVQGWDAYTVVLSGTRVPSDPDGAIVKGALYGLSWMAMVVCAPVLAGGSGLWLVMRQLRPAP